jgi:DtxR family Mn-dependent transcriptional regulator
MTTPSIEDYVKAIYKAEALGEVTSQDIAKRVGVSAPAVSKMLRKLKALKFVSLHHQTGIHLTPFGLRTALQTIRRHRLLELYLVRELGYRWDEVHAEAEQLEHYISPLFEERIAERLGHPEVDPHGDPIPSANGVMPISDDKRLTTFAEHSELVITRVMDRDPDLLRYVAELQLLPGVRITFLGQQPFGGPFTIMLHDKVIALAPDAAQEIFARIANNV